MKSLLRHNRRPSLIRLWLEFSEGAVVRGGDRHLRHQRGADHRRPGQLFSAEHLVRTHHNWACTAAPITDPATGWLLNVLDVSGPLDAISADTLRMGRCAVRVAESLLGTSDGGASLSASSFVRASPQGARRPVAAVSSLELLGDKPAAVLADGSRVPLTLHQSEILALLDSRSQGWSAEELAYELHGDAGTPQAIRTEMFRVRSMLGDAVKSNPYRLAAGLAGCSDSGRVLRLLREGTVAEVLVGYTAPLLIRSGVLAWCPPRRLPKWPRQRLGMHHANCPVRPG